VKRDWKKRSCEKNPRTWRSNDRIVLAAISGGWLNSKDTLKRARRIREVLRKSLKLVVVVVKRRDVRLREKKDVLVR
jgi:hypothetical protein